MQKMLERGNIEGGKRNGQLNNNSVPGSVDRSNNWHIVRKEIGIHL